MKTLLSFSGTRFATKYQNGEANAEPSSHLKLNQHSFFSSGENFSVDSNEVPAVHNTEWVPSVQLMHSVPPLK